jgi:hypothetical protein
MRFHLLQARYLRKRNPVVEKLPDQGALGTAKHEAGRASTPGPNEL